MVTLNDVSYIIVDMEINFDTNAITVLIEDM